MKLTIATINLPADDNHGNPLDLERRRVERRLGHTFGGFTRNEAEGFWIDPADGQEYAEKMYVYEIAGTWDAVGCIQLRQIAWDAAVELRQKCIYMNTPLLGVQFVGPFESKAGAEVAA